MTKGRLETFSDRVIAILIMIMVLDLKIPSGNDIIALNSILLIFMSYILSYLFNGIYWSNHHLLHAVRQGRSFWLSLIPFTTNWMGRNFLSPWTVAVYGFDLLVAAIAYFLLSRSLIKHNGKESLLGLAVGRDAKGILSIIA